MLPCQSIAEQEEEGLDAAERDFEEHARASLSCIF